jgi:hypothetical protein
LSNSDFDFDGYTPAIGDCDDSDASINPAAVDVSDDGIDNDCDGFEVTSLDYDGDGYIAIGAGGTDCDDTNDLVNPYQSNFFLTPRSNGTYDYNCDGQETKQYRVCGESDTLFCFGGGVLPECGESGNMATDSYACGPFGFDTCYDINPVPQGCN